ncbi:MAG: hypothetical protein ACI4VQ_04530, partial [Clostridia bacterium]
NSTIQEMLFEGTLEEDNWAKVYWLASPGVACGSSDAHFGPGGVVGGGVVAGGGLFGSGGGWGAVSYAVRPVVCLNSDITVNQLQVIEGELETWTYDNSNPVGGDGDASTGEAGTETGSK